MTAQDASEKHNKNVHQTKQMTDLSGVGTACREQKVECAARHGVRIITGAFHPDSATMEVERWEPFGRIDVAPDAMSDEIAQKVWELAPALGAALGALDTE